MCLVPAEEGPEEAYCGWTLHDRLELLAFDARLADVPAALIAALWEAIDPLREGQAAP
jgi:hypothetical protein